jgi:hypothetical protein
VGLPATDQRGFARTVNGQVDAGAFQIQAGVPAVSDVGVTFSPNGQNVTLTASVTSTSGPVNEGHVAFSVAGVSGVAAVSGGSASGQLTLPGLGAGPYAISAAYFDSLPPDPGHFRDGSGAGTLTVNAAPTTTTVVSVSRVGLFGLMEKVTVKVLDAAGNPVSGGSVTITDGALSQTVDLSGGTATATFSPSVLVLILDAFFSHNVTAAFGGTANDLGSTSATFVAAPGTHLGPSVRANPSLAL